MTGKALPGERTKGTTSARDYNTLRDVAREFRDGRLDPPNRRGIGPGDITPATAVLGYRAVGATTLAAYSPVVLHWADADLGADVGEADGQIFPFAWLLNPTVRLDSPARGDAGRAVGVVAETVEAGQFKKVWTAGVCVARVYVENLTHEYAGLNRNYSDALVSGTAGPVRILCNLTGETGRQLCVVLLNAGGGGGTGDSFWGIVTGDDGTDEPNTLYSWAECTSDGSPIDGGATGVSNLRRARSNGTPPKIPPGQVVRIWAGAEEGEYECPAPGGLQTVAFYTKEYEWNSSTCVMTTHTYLNQITGRDLSIANRVEV